MRHNSHASANNTTFGLSIFFYMTAFLSLVGWVTQLILLIRVYGLAHLIRNMWILQNEFSMRFVGYLNIVGILVLPTFIIKIKFQRCRLIDYTLVVSAIIGLVLAGIKQYLVFSMVSGAFAYSSLYPRRVRLRHVLTLAVCILAFFAVYDKIIDVFVVKSHPGSVFPAWLSFLERPYVYLVGSWPAMDHIVFQTPPQPIGAYVTFQPLWKVLGDALGVIDRVPPYLPFVDIGCGLFNVYSFAGEVYWDFGLLGVVVLSSLVGCISTLLFMKARRSGFWAWHLVYATFMYGVFMSFFLYYFRFGMIFLLLYCWTFSLLPYVFHRRIAQHYAA